MLIIRLIQLFRLSSAKIQKIKQLACFYPKTIVLFTKNKIIEQGL